MLYIDKKFLNHIKKNITFYFLSTVSIFALSIRLISIDYISGDMKFFLLPWYYEAIRLGGIKSIGYEIGNYNIPYQFFISLLSSTSINPIIGYKLFSIFFDFILAIAMGILIMEFVEKEKIKYFTYMYSIVLLLPTIFFNSGFWGQADSIYVSFIIISLILFNKKKFNLSFLVLGIAFSFKLQTIFILPTFIYYYFINKKFSIIKLGFFTFLGMYILCIPGFIYGRSFLDPIKVYLGQTKEPYIWINFPSLWSWIAPTYEASYIQTIRYISILLCGMVLLSGIYYIVKNNININNNKVFMLLTIWTVYTCLIFLTGMHDRYGYLLDLLFIVILFLEKEFAIFGIIPFFIGLITYVNYLFFDSEYIPEYIFKMLSLLYLINYILLTNKILKYTLIYRDKNQL
ncbi:MULTISPECIES: hypothetical protein [unclassified Gemella]|uniref:hypothetical protein n=1 Tax=unclassified Gemella TaxID=2624949 RepID=UPI001C0447F4|nr:MULTISPECIES: hypothetical protein [unclassified Gemella]MBU0278250.1 hypothetical protein [Gemella sp. zg-1178]QWQ38795.1 hypothetical protein KMP11_00055 [Gemella sp. zg-570]